MWRVLRWVNKLVIYLILTPIFLICIYAIYDFWCCMRQTVAGDKYEAVVARADFDWDANENVVAFLTIDNTTIHYPVVQAADNDWYLTRDENGDYSVAGSIFLDYRNAADFSDGFNIIYGHRMSQGRMFSDIANFEDKEFFESHRSGRILRQDEEVEVEVIAFARVKVDSELYMLELRKASEQNLQLIEREAMYFRRPEAEGRIFMLSTCNRESKSVRDVLVVLERKTADGHL